MNAASWFLLGIATAFAVGDWAAVELRRRQLEYVCKPATIAALMLVALAVDVDDPTVRHWFLAALALSLVGDVFLMLPHDLFVPGLVSFLLGHVAYIAGMWADGVDVLGLAIGIAVAAVAVVTIGGRINRAVRAGEHAAMAMPVGAYMAVISLMLVSAIGTTEGLAIAGALLFYCSDALIAWERFVRPHVWHRMAIIVTYHLAQAALTLSLVT